jgi:enoyl-CoA hydratase/carnithine racemase
MELLLVTPSFDEYSDRFPHVRMSRTDGVLVLQLHSDGGPLVWGAAPHEELGDAFAAVGPDPGNRVIVLTGTGDAFCAALDDSWVGAMTPGKWDRIHSNGRRLLHALLDIECPVVAAVNGPARIHAELALLADVVLASEDAYFQDAPHFRAGTVPGDGVHAVWPALLGPNRGRYFLLTGQKISAPEALRLGLVGEVLPAAQLLPRALELASELARHPDVVLRLTRAALAQPLRRLVLDSVHAGLALEGLGAYATWPEAVRS